MFIVFLYVSHSVPSKCKNTCKVEKAKILQNKLLNDYCSRTNGQLAQPIYILVLSKATTSLSVPTMQVSPWTLTADEINVYTVFTEIFTGLYVENGEWDLAETSAMNYTRYVRPP